MPDVVVVGSLSMDLTAGTATLPKAGETVLGTSFTMVPGGKGNNQAVTCARQGVLTTMVGRVGPDAFGDAIRAQLVAEGVDVSHLTTDRGGATGIAHITVDANGQNFIIVVPRSNHALSAEDVHEANELIDRAAVLLVQCEVRLEVVHAALETARRAGTVTMLNPAPALELDEEILSKVDICLPNEVEAATLTHMRVDDIDGAIQGCSRPGVSLAVGRRRHLGRQRGRLRGQRACARGVCSFGPGCGHGGCRRRLLGAFASAKARGCDLESALGRARRGGCARRGRARRDTVVAVGPSSGRDARVLGRLRAGPLSPPNA